MCWKWWVFRESVPGHGVSEPRPCVGETPEKNIKKRGVAVIITVKHQQSVDRSVGGQGRPTDRPANRPTNKTTDQSGYQTAILGKWLKVFLLLFL